MSDVVVESLLEDVEGLAKRWVLALVAARPLREVSGIPLERLAAEAPAVCADVLRALASDEALDRIARRAESGTEPAADQLAQRVAELGGADDAPSTVHAVETLRSAIWQGLEPGPPGLSAGQVGALSDRLAHVCSLLCAQALGVEAEQLRPQAEQDVLDGEQAVPQAEEAVLHAEEAGPGAEQPGPAAAAPGLPAEEPQFAPERPGPAPEWPQPTPEWPLHQPSRAPGREGAWPQSPAPARSWERRAAEAADEAEPAAQATPESPVEPAALGEGGPAAGFPRIELREAQEEEAREGRDLGWDMFHETAEAQQPEESTAQPWPGGSASWLDSVAAELEPGAQTSQRLAILVIEVVGIEYLRRSEGVVELGSLMDKVEDAIESGLRPGDRLAEEGAGRWWLVAPQTSSNGARILAERLAGKVRAAVSHRSIPVDISVGVASAPSDGEDAAQLAERAESELFAARASGLSVAPGR